MVNKTGNDLDKNTNSYQHTYQINIFGIVQGVGFRPFIYRLAKKHGLCGFVTNTTEGVFIKVNARNKAGINNFIKDIKLLQPLPSKIEKIYFKETSGENFSDFKIKKSMETAEKFQLISPDIATCKQCIEDINDANNKRRYYYPFTNCTNCGPRFTIIKKMPYDRPNTTMSKFNLCDDCSHEYSDVSDRRFHAQPNACRRCGPKLALVNKKGKIIDDKNPIISAAKKIKNGHILGLKSLGGFQIVCNAAADRQVLKLRKRKNRPFKPFAIMIGDIEIVKKHFVAGRKEIEALTSSAAPIVLLKKREDSRPVSKHVSGYNKFEGVMLPYTPIHHLLFNHIDTPLVMTSGNISEEPIASKNNEALDKLENICDYFLIHNRDIYSKYDDSVIKIFAGREMIIRRARGYAPYPVKLDIDTFGKTILSLGAQEKNTFCLLIKKYALVSQHLGDLDSLDSFEFFKFTLEDYKSLFNITNIDLVVHDKHPGYTSTKFAKNLDSTPDKLEIQHHKAHIASVIAENNIKDDILGFSWDGTGYGDDGKIWGSEVFVVDKSMKFTRVGHLLEKPLPGGEAAIKKPYRMALAYLYSYWEKYVGSDKISKLANQKSIKYYKFSDFVFGTCPFYKGIVSELEIEATGKQIKTKFNCPVTTSMGRFFDAVSSSLNLVHINSYEGEAAICLEMTADEENDGIYDIKLDKLDNKYIIDDLYIFVQIQNDFKSGIKVNKISAKFHNTLARIVLDISSKIRQQCSIGSIALSGGVFQNDFLLNKCYDSLQKKGFKVYSNFKVPVNDGGISLGQAYLAAYEILFRKKKEN